MSLQSNFSLLKRWHYKETKTITWESWTAFQYCSIQNVTPILPIEIKSWQEAIQLYQLEITGLMMILQQVINMQPLALQPILAVVIQRQMIWLWKTFYSIWLMFYFLYHIWHHLQDMVRWAYIPDSVLAFSFWPRGHGTSSVLPTCLCGILLLPFSMLDSYFIFSIRYHMKFIIDTIH